MTTSSSSFPVSLKRLPFGFYNFMFVLVFGGPSVIIYMLPFIGYYLLRDLPERAVQVVFVSFIPRSRRWYVRPIKKRSDLTTTLLPLLQSWKSDRLCVVSVYSTVITV